jgi:hypothetical protein
MMNVNRGCALGVSVLDLLSTDYADVHRFELSLHCRVGDPTFYAALPGWGLRTFEAE